MDGRECLGPTERRSDRRPRPDWSRRRFFSQSVAAKCLSAPRPTSCSNTATGSGSRLIIDRCKPHGKKKPEKPWPSGEGPALVAPPSSPATTWRGEIWWEKNEKKMRFIEACNSLMKPLDKFSFWFWVRWSNRWFIVTKSWPRTWSDGSRRNMLKPEMRLMTSSLVICSVSISWMATSKVTAEPTMAICWK